MIAKEAWLFVIPGKVLMVFLIILASRFNSYVLFGFSLLAAILTLFTVFFFRDPDRVTPSEAGILVSPADGRIVAVDSLEHHPHVGGPAVKISIFLSVFDVHVNRVPASGVVDYVKYNPGEFFKAYEDKASELNEQTEIGLTTPGGYKIVFKQIAGIIARRIVCRLSDSDSVSAGDRMGLIRFGSRMDLIFPQAGRVTVKMGDKVVAGETIMGYLPESQAVVDSLEGTKGNYDQL